MWYLTQKTVLKTKQGKYLYWALFMALLCDYIVKNWSVYALHHLFCEKSAKTVISSILYVEKSVYRHTRFS